MGTFYRRLPKFDYISPGSIEEVLDLLSNCENGKCQVYAGGTDVIPKLKRRIADKPEILVDLKGIPGLDYVDYDAQNGLRIGALATIRSVATSPEVIERFPMLSKAAGSIASNQIQNRGTMAGNICNAIPSADSAPALLCLEARLLCISKKGERLINIEDFFKGPGETALYPDELLKEIQIPLKPEKSHGVYIKLSTRKRMDLAVVGVAAMVETGNGVVKDVRIGLGAVAPVAMRARKSEEILKGKRAVDETIHVAAKTASEESRPIDDHRASAEYRKMMVEVLVKRAIHQALSN